MYLVFWTKLAQLTLLGVQLSSPLACEAQRNEYAKDPTVDAAQCIHSDHDLERFLKKHDCSIMEGRDNFANYVCSKTSQ